MTTTPAPSLTVITPTGSAVGPWPTGFKYGEAADVRVFFTVDGVSQPDLTHGNHYAVTGLTPTINGGSVTLSPAVVPAGGWQAGAVRQVVIARRTVRRQGLALPDTEGHRPRQTEAALDKAMRLHEEHAEGLGRTVAAPIGEGGFELQPAAVRDGGLARFIGGGLRTFRLEPGAFLLGDGNGEPISGAGVAPGEVAVSTFGAELVLSGAAPAARDTLELGGAATRNVGNLTGQVADGGYLAEVASSRRLPVVIDWHWTALCGKGWNPAEAGGIVEKAFGAAGAAGDMTVTVSAGHGASFIDDQLIAYQAVNGQHYSAVVREVDGDVLKLDRPLRAAVAPGGAVGPGYIDNNHPARLLARALADEGLRQLDGAGIYELIDRQTDWQDWWPHLSGSTVAAYGTLNYKNPGSDLTGLQAARVTGGGQYRGAMTRPRFLPAGDYRMVAVANPGHIDGSPDLPVELLVFPELEAAGNATFVPRSVTLKGIDGPQRVVVDFAKTDASRVRAYVQCQTAGDHEVLLGGVNFYRRTGTLPSLNRPLVIACIGNSWFAPGLPWIIDRWAEQLPNATVHRMGVNGNTIDQILARFGDVEALNPDIVISDLGVTNDYAQNTRRDIYEARVGEFVRRCNAIGAQPILINSTVGDAADAAQLQNSRGYAVGLDYHVRGPGDRSLTFEATLSKRTLAPGEKIALIAPAAYTTLGAQVRQFQYAVSASTVWAYMGFATTLSPPGSLENEIAFGGVTGLEVNEYVVTKTGANSRRFMCVFHNTSGVNQEVDATIRVDLTPL